MSERPRLAVTDMCNVSWQEAVLCPDPQKEYPGAGGGKGKREILPLRVFLSAAGCLTEERWADTTHAATLKKLEALCGGSGSLKLTAEDEVNEAMRLLLMARQGFSSTIRRVQRDLVKRCNSDSTSMNMENFYESMKFVVGWESYGTWREMQRGRELFGKADLWPEEVLGARLYTGPQFMHYNASLRGFPQWVLVTMCGNRYVTTIHCINSAIIKLARASPIDPLVVHRGSQGMRLPLQFARKDDLGRQGDVELGFMSCTAHKSVALDYAAGGKMPMLLSFERGAMDNGGPLSPLSFYMDEEEVCFPSLCSIEVTGKPEILFTEKGAVLHVKMGITVNQKADTIDKLVERRRFLHLGSLRNLKQEVESELQNVDALLSVSDGESSLAGSQSTKDIRDFVDNARKTCKSVLEEHDKKLPAVYNDDDFFSELTSQAVLMKKNALKNQHELLGAWFAHSAKKDVRALEAVVRQLDAHMWSDARVLDQTQTTPLLAACGAGSFEICDALVKAGADVKAADKAH